MGYEKDGLVCYGDFIYCIGVVCCIKEWQV